jgi:adenylate kinase
MSVNASFAWLLYTAGMTTQPLTVLFFGPQGCGKGTQVKLLVEKLVALDAAQVTDGTMGARKIVQIDMGAIFRASIAEGTITSQKTAEIINVGKRMPDFMPVYLSTKVFAEQILTNTEHLIADGLCRGEDQTRGWDDAMQFYGRENYQIIMLELSAEESVKRLLARGRNDDTEEGIRSRLGWYKTDVEPQLALMQGRGRTIHRINGDQSMEAVHANIVKVLNFA